MSNDEILYAKKQINSQNMFVILMNSFHEAVYSFSPLKLDMKKYSPSKSIDITGLETISPADAILLGTECVSVMCDQSKVFNYENIDDLFDLIYEGYENKESLEVGGMMPTLLAKTLSDNLHLTEVVSVLIDKKNQPAESMSHGLN
jgi:hypothetical protein